MESSTGSDLRRALEFQEGAAQTFLVTGVRSPAWGEVGLQLSRLPGSLQRQLRRSSRRTGLWVLTYEFKHDRSENLLDKLHPRAHEAASLSGTGRRSCLYKHVENSEASFFFLECCRLGMPWLKRTCILTSFFPTTYYASASASSALTFAFQATAPPRMPWTKVAEPYPRKLNHLLAQARSRRIEAAMVCSYKPAPT